MEMLLVNKICVIVFMAITMIRALNTKTGEFTNTINAYKSFPSGLLSLTLLYFSGFFNGLFTGGHFVAQIIVITMSIAGLFQKIKMHGEQETTYFTHGQLVVAYAVIMIIYWAGGLFEVFYK